MIQEKMLGSLIYSLVKKHRTVSCFVLIPLIAATVLTAYTSQAATPQPAAFQLNAIYLTGTSRPTLDVTQAKGFGVRTVSSATALTQVADATVVMIDSSSLSSVSGAWLANQVKQGHVIVAFNVPISQLERQPSALSRLV